MLLYIDHGRGPRDVTYEYTLAFAPDTDVGVLSNTPQVQAAIDRRSNVIGIAFWQAGNLVVGARVIEVDQPCLVLVHNDRLTVANPRNTPLTARIRVNEREQTIEMLDGASVSCAL
jgi:hypothetical protein